MKKVTNEDLQVELDLAVEDIARGDLRVEDLPIEVNDGVTLAWDETDGVLLAISDDDDDRAEVPIGAAWHLPDGELVVEHADRVTSLGTHDEDTDYALIMAGWRRVGPWADAAAGDVALVRGD